MMRYLEKVGTLLLFGAVCSFAKPVCISGIYPHLAMFNDGGECGTGAVVPWAGRLWTLTYSPHKPRGSTDKLYEITSDLRQIVRPESIGGTPANRMIHRESDQLFIGPYAIDGQGKVRAIPYSRMVGRPTANMRHLSDPANKIYYATMEEGFYEVDVHTLAVKELYRDGNRQRRMGGSLLPGYHGKGAYSGQGRVVYANNGELSSRAQYDPETPSGVLAEWDGKNWRVVLRNQFTDVTGPGGIYGNRDPENDPVWAIGWDAKSLILMVLDQGRWWKYRLPKGSHSYDGATGWNTEWPRIREIGEGKMLMTMHGTFWEFPPTFSAKNSAGIRPRSNYIKVIGDFCRWGERVVFGCDDSAKSEFLNKRKAKGSLIGPQQSNSNLWFLKPDEIDRLGPVIGRGLLWKRETLSPGTVSDAYLFEGYDRKTLYLAHQGEEAAAFDLEIDRRGNQRWEKAGLKIVAEPGRVNVFSLDGERGCWIRLRSRQRVAEVYASLQYANSDTRTERPDPIFSGIADLDEDEALGGWLYGRGGGLKTLGVAAIRGEKGKSRDVGFYQLSPEMKLERIDDPKSMAFAKRHYGMDGKGISVDAASVLLVDDLNRRWRFPKAAAEGRRGRAFSSQRFCREVCTERDLLSIGGTFYELPAKNAGGVSLSRALASPRFQIHDYCSWRGLLVMTGIRPDAPPTPHLIRSEDGRAALWAGAVDDLWKAGKARGFGGPWMESRVKAGEISDPYLMTGFDRKRLLLSQSGGSRAEITMEIDLTGTGVWKVYKRWTLDRKPLSEDLGQLRGYWLRFRSGTPCTITAQLVYD